MKTLRRVSAIIFVTYSLAVSISAHPSEDNVSKAKDEIIEVKHTNAEETEEIKKSYDGYQLWKVNVDTDDSKSILAKLKTDNDIATWGGNMTNIDIMVEPDKVGKIQEEFDHHSIRYRVIQENIQDAIDNENFEEDLDEKEARQGHRMTFDSYHRLRDIHDYLDYLERTYPSLCKTYSIGSSVRGNTLKILRISNGNPNNRAVWVDGGMHAREWISPATVTYIINYLVVNYQVEDASLQNIDWYFLPIANPDGYEYSHTVDRLWRKNRARSGRCAGTDLNRNYGYRWGGAGVSKNPCAETYGGTGPFSEPETAAIRDFLQNTHPYKWKASVSLHSYGQYILYPWGHERSVPPDHADLHRVAKAAANAIRSSTGLSYTIGPAAQTLYPASGGSDDWAKGIMNIKYAYTIELRDSGYHGFVLPSSYIQPSGREALAALKEIAKAAAVA